MLLLQLRKHSSLCDSGVRGEIILVTKKEKKIHETVEKKGGRNKKKDKERERERGKMR